MRLPIRLRELLGLFLVIAVLFVAAGPGAISARGANTTFGVSGSAACTNRCFSNLVVTGTFTVDLTTGVVSGGTMFLTDLADLKSSPVALAFKSQQPFTTTTEELFFANSNFSSATLIFPFASFPANYTGGVVCNSGTFPVCGNSPASIAAGDESPAALAAGINGSNFVLISGSAWLLPTPPPNPRPLLYLPVPSSTAPGGPAFSLTVTGSGFVSGAVANWNGSARPTTFVNGNQLTAAITAADIATHGTAVITVTNPAPGGGPSNPEFFQITNAVTPPNFTLFGNAEIDAYRARPSNTVVADFNRDGKLDIAEYANGIIYVLPGNGDGTFPPGGWIESSGPPPPPTGATNITHLAVADINGDGIPDLVLMNINGTYIHFGLGNGKFGAGGYFSDWIQDGSIAVADFNGDGLMALAYIKPPIVPQHVPSSIQVQFWNADGTFRAAEAMPFVNPNPSTNPGPEDLVAVLGTGDFNGDGKPDLLILAVNHQGCTAGLYTLWAFPGNGDGTFGNPSQLPGTATCGDLTPSAAVADFNGDGKPDVAYFAIESGGLNSGPAFLSVSLGNGDGTFGVPFQAISPIPPNFSSATYGPVLAADLNGDGKLDLVTGNQIFYGNGNGTFIPQGPAQNNGMQAIYLGDFNADGQVDLLALGTNPSNSSLFDLRILLQQSGPQDFTGSLASLAQTVLPGGTATFAGNVVPVNGFTGNVALTATGVPSGVTPLFIPATITGGSGSYTLTLTVGASVPLGTYNITITGTSGALTHSATVTLIVNSSVGDFSAAIAAGSDSYQDIIGGQSATYTFQFTPSGGFNGNVGLTVSGGLPAGAIATFNPATVVGGSGSSTLTVTTLPSTAINTYTLLITGTSGVLSHTGSVFLGVRTTPGDFTGFISPSSQTITVGQTATFVANITYLNGFTAGLGLNLSVTGLPPGAQFTETNATVTSLGETDTFTISAPPGTPPGTYTLLLTGSGGGRIRSAPFTLTIN